MSYVADVCYVYACVCVCTDMCCVYVCTYVLLCVPILVPSLIPSFYRLQFMNSKKAAGNEASMCLSLYLCVCLSVCLSSCLSVSPVVCVSVYPAVCMRMGEHSLTSKGPGLGSLSPNSDTGERGDVLPLAVRFLLLAAAAITTLSLSTLSRLSKTTLEA